MQQQCRLTGRMFEITAGDLEFYRNVSPKIGGRVYDVPPPTLCPEERQRRRCAFRNFHKLYVRKCSATGKQMVSMHHEDAPFPVYNPDYWWSDNWNPYAFGREFDFNRPFFEQFYELQQSVPRLSISAINCENCSYLNMAFNSKNCYLIGGVIESADCMYGHVVWHSENCQDVLYAYRSQWCSNCVDIVGCYEVHFSQECEECSESYFLYNCNNCKHCFGCTNLRNKSYCFLNEQLSKADYEAKMQEILPLTPAKIQHWTSELSKLKRQAIHPHLFGYQSENITGNHVYYSHDVRNSFDIKESENIAHMYTCLSDVNSYDCCFGGLSEWCYECLTQNSSNGILFSTNTTFSNQILYSDLTHASNNLFGCIGIKNGSYSILNKKYPKAEYEKLAPRIIEHMRTTGEWGEFFPHHVSPFAYNESIAQEYYPTAKAEVMKEGWRWKEEEHQAPNVEKIIPGEKLPANIDAIPDDVLNWAIRCNATGKPFKLQKPELEYYRRMHLPVPRFHPEERHRQRMMERNPRRLWDRDCDKCGTAIRTSFAPERPEQVYCEKCYPEAIG